LVLHDDDPDQHDDDRPLRAEDGHILRQAIIPNMGLHQVQEDEERGCRQRDLIDAMESVGILFNVGLRIPN
jgi:hypothetical protein